jgi:hypothetical protein
VWFVVKHHGTMPGKLLPYKQLSMFQSSAIQEHPAFHRAYYRMLRLTALLVLDVQACPFTAACQPWHAQDETCIT